MTGLLAVAALAAATWLVVSLNASGPALAPSPDVMPSSPTSDGRLPASLPAGATSDHPAIPTGAFDYYVLSLSWSPSFCENADAKRDRLQCAGERPYAFIVHGLWPQNEAGYPQDCPTDTPRVPDTLIDEMLDIMPSRGLIGHEWRAHGACTGLSQQDFFAEVRRAYEAVTVPTRFDHVEQPLSLPPGEIAEAFLKANPGRLTAGAIVITCGRGVELDEVRLCMDKDLHFRDCGQQTAHAACRRDTVAIPPERGG